MRGPATAARAASRNNARSRPSCENAASPGQDAPAKEVPATPHWQFHKPFTRPGKQIHRPGYWISPKWVRLGDVCSRPRATPGASSAEPTQGKLTARSRPHTAHESDGSIGHLPQKGALAADTLIGPQRTRGSDVLTETFRVDLSHLLKARFPLLYRNV